LGMVYSFLKRDRVGKGGGGEGSGIRQSKIKPASKLGTFRLWCLCPHNAAVVMVHAHKLCS